MAVLLSLKNISSSFNAIFLFPLHVLHPLISLTVSTSLLSLFLSPSYYGAGATEEWFSKGKLLLLYDLRFARSELLALVLVFHFRLGKTNIVHNLLLTARTNHSHPPEVFGIYSSFCCGGGGHGGGG